MTVVIYDCHIFKVEATGRKSGTSISPCGRGRRMSRERRRRNPRKAFRLRPLVGCSPRGPRERSRGSCSAPSACCRRQGRKPECLKFEVSISANIHFAKRSFYHVLNQPITSSRVIHNQRNGVFT
jgi:hypothetical protein